MTRSAIATAVPVVGSIISEATGTVLAVAFYYVLIVTVFSYLLKRLERHLDVSQRTPRPVPDSHAHLPTAPLATRHGDFALRVLGARKHYGELEVLKGIDLDIRFGEVVSIIGPSGSGKTTLIRTLNGLEGLDRGQVELCGRPFLRGRLEDGGSLSSRLHLEGIVQVGRVSQYGSRSEPGKVVSWRLLAPASGAIT